MDIQKKIAAARNDARILYNEVEKVRKRVQNTNLTDTSCGIPTIPRNYCNLKLYSTLTGHRGKIAKVQWSNDSYKLISASQDGFMIVWDTVTGFKKQAITLENQWVLTCGLSPTGKIAATGGLDNALTIYELRGDFLAPRTYGTKEMSYEMSSIASEDARATIKGHTAYISDCKFINDNSILTASGDMTCALWDIAKRVKVRSFVDHLGDVLCLDTFSAVRPNTFLSGASDGYVKVWDTRVRENTQTFFISNSDVNTVRCFPEGNSFITGSDDGLVRFYDLRSDCELSTFSLASKLHLQTPTFTTKDVLGPDNFSTKTTSIYSSIENPGVYSIDCSPSGRFIYTCYSEFGCMIWDSLKNEIVGSIGNEHTNKINQVSVSPDGLAVATASWDSTIKIWSI